MPLFDAISSLFSHKAVSAVTNPHISSVAIGSGAVITNAKSYKKSCSAPKLKDLFDEELPCDQPRKPSCGKQKDEMWRIQLLEELRRLEEQSQMSESEHSSTREFLLQQLAHYEQELLKVQKSETIVKEERVPIPVRVPVPIAVRVPVIQRETRVISQSPCRNASLCPWRGRSCAAAASPCAQRARSSGSIARLIARGASPCAARRAVSGCRRCSAGIDVDRYKARLSELGQHERALTKRLSARKSLVTKVGRTLSKLQRAHAEEQKHLAKVANDKRKTVQKAFQELQEKKEEEYRAHADRITSELRKEQERLADHMSMLQDWREQKMTEMNRLQQSAGLALRSYDAMLRRQLSPAF